MGLEDILPPDHRKNVEVIHGHPLREVHMQDQAAAVVEPLVQTVAQPRQDADRKDQTAAPVPRDPLE